MPTQKIAKKEKKDKNHLEVHCSPMERYQDVSYRKQTQKHGIRNSPIFCRVDKDHKTSIAKKQRHNIEDQNLFDSLQKISKLS